MEPGQPRGRRGTHDRPYTALNLRLGLAIFGMVATAFFAWLSAWAGLRVLMWIFIVFAVIALIDLVVILWRKSKRRGGHSLFE
ncbi:hypothetical protein [Bailinhaonella thermotolerans]|uniref:Uncharacterized protein n=1 Tax=Bailinhaonella thermotolerans TaxID=1070861 RepID=A0A3A4A9S1_9ACTN|nr:hypothetical protein [Bailinhaonella thermotolerans]RJL22076.1 hypothetical protein D5H75_36385 [Bailinhaonella thermotolerans]